MKNIQSLVHFASHGAACFAASQQTTTALLFWLFSKEILNAAGELLTRKQFLRVIRRSPQNILYFR